MEYKKKVLILNGQYIPGYKGGGPIQSCFNMVENLSNDFDFYVVCADRDYKAEKPYDNVIINQWNQVGSAKVFYMSPDKQSFRGFKEILNKTEYDVLYLNGFFSPIFTIRPLLLHKLGKLKKTKIILTPRGDFTGGCENKKIKKYTYIYLMKFLGVYDNLLWHATSEIERKDILKKFSNAKVYTTPNLPAKFVEKPIITKKIKGELRLVFVSRIFPKKNIKYALEVLKEIDHGNVLFDIYGPMEDEDYWNECKKIIEKMPQNIKVNYCGEAPHNDIPHIFEQYHAFFFPTLGENYGHVIVEAMMNNCLCILSKGVTPWDNYIELLDIGAFLNQKEKFVSIINNLIELDDEEFRKAVGKNNLYIAKATRSDLIVEKYKGMLNK